jgi:hypothetical protein
MASACSCGNFQLSGRSLPTGVYPNIPSSERPRLALCSSLLALVRDAIRISDLSQTEFRVQNQCCSDLFCIGCKTTFRIFLGYGAAYAGAMPDQPKPSIKPPASPSDVNPRSVPLGLQPYVRVAAPQRGGIAIADSSAVSPSDPDFELMFSGRVAPIVGSCRADAGFGEIRMGGGADFVPRSYSRQTKMPKLIPQ